MKKRMHLVLEAREYWSEKKIGTPTVMLSGTEQECRRELFRLFNLNNRVDVPGDLSKVWELDDDADIHSAVQYCWKIVRYCSNGRFSPAPPP